MTELIDNFSIILPEIIILVTACLTIFAELFLSRFKSSSWFIAIVGVIAAGFVSYLFLGNYRTTTLGGLFVGDDVANIMKLFIYLNVFLCFIYSKQYLAERDMPAGDYYVLGLLSTLGMMVLVSAHHLLTVYLGLELLSLPLYTMTAIRRTNRDAAEAAMKYFVMGALASGMLLYGISLLYGATGKLDLVDIANVVASSWEQNRTLLSFALVFIIAGIGFKLAAAPFHMWAPDVYQGAPTAVTMFISSAPKIAAMGMIFRVLTLGLPAFSFQWQQLVLVMALLSTALGNLLAIVQPNIKRLLAYSAIANIGYALFGLVVANNVGYSAALYYVLVYSLMSVAALGLIVLLSHKGSEMENISDLKGLNKRNPWLAFMMLIVMFSLAGIPPTVGFFAKLLVLKSLVDAHLTWVAVYGLLFAVIGAYYSIRIVKAMYFDEVKEFSQGPLSNPVTLIYSINCLSLLILGIFPSGLIAMCMNAF